MATKRYKGGPDWDFVLKEVFRDTPAKKLIEGGAARIIIDKIGVDGLMAVLTPEQLRKLAKRIEAAEKRSKSQEVRGSAVS
jgi:hypothetical protein